MPDKKATDGYYKRKKRKGTRKYRNGRQITSIADFDQCESIFYIVRFGENTKTVHRSFLISWQYSTLLNFIQKGWVFEAVKEGD